MTTPMRISNELRVGIMFLTGLVLLVLLIVTLTRWGQDRNTYSFTMRFNQAQGILEGAAVRVAGVQVGRVTSVDFDSTTNEALVTARVNHKVRLYSNYHYTIGIGGLVGERFVEIHPVDRNRGGLLVDGSSVDGRTTPDMNELFESSNRLIARLTDTADSLNEIVASPENQRNLHDTLANFNKTSIYAADFAHGLDKLYQRDAPSVDTLVANLKSVSEDARHVSESLAPQLEHTNIIRNLEEASSRASDITRRFESITDNVSSLVNDKEVTDSLRTTLSNFHKASEDLDVITAEVRTAARSFPRIATNLERGSDRVPVIAANVERATVDLPTITGNLARATDYAPAIAKNLESASEDIPDITSNLNRATADLPQITAPLRDIAPETAANIQCISENLLTASENANNITQRISNSTSGLSCLTIKPLVRVTALVGDHNTARTEADLDFRTPCTLFRAGIVGEYNRTFVNLQAGSKISDNAWLRFGMIQSHLGAGVDYELDPNLIFSGDLFDANRPRINALVDFHPKSLGDSLWLNVGVYNLFQHASFGVGLTYRP